MNLERALHAAEEFITPVAVVDEEVLDRNLARMAKLAADHGVRLRPHAKTHKSAEVALRQIAHGAVGLTAATFVEAEVFAAAGVQDLLLAHPPVGPLKLARLSQLAATIPRVAVSVDDLDITHRLPGNVDVLWEVDTGLHRIGTAPGAPTVEAVLRLIEAVGSDRFRGLITHAGHVYASARRSADGRPRRRAMAC